MIIFFYRNSHLNWCLVEMTWRFSECIVLLELMKILLCVVGRTELNSLSILLGFTSLSVGSCGLNSSGYHVWFVRENHCYGIVVSWIEILIFFLLFGNRLGATAFHDCNLVPCIDLFKLIVMYWSSCSVYYLYFRVFLAGQFESLHAHLEAMIPANKRAFLSQFYSQVRSGRIILQSPQLREMAWHRESNKACNDSISDSEYFPGITATSLQKCGFKSYWLWSGRLLSLHVRTEQLL